LTNPPNEGSYFLAKILNAVAEFVFETDVGATRFYKTIDARKSKDLTPTMFMSNL
jgi:hypothetical protein